MSQPRPVKVNFPNFAPRQAAWNARFSLKGSPHSVFADLLLSIRIQRAKQRIERISKSGLIPRPTNSTTPEQNTPPVTDSPPNPRRVFSPRRKTTATPKLHPVFTLKTANMRRRRNRKRKQKKVNPTTTSTMNHLFYHHGPASPS